MSLARILGKYKVWTFLLSVGVGKATAFRHEGAVAGIKLLRTPLGEGRRAGEERSGLLLLLL